MKSPMYLDSNATSPLDEEVWQAMLPWWREQFHNPSSSYRGAKLARRAIEEARGHVATLLGAQEDEIIFTSGGTESINTILRSWDADAGEGVFLTTAVEHSAVLRTGESLDRPMQKCAVDGLGRLVVDEWQSLIAQSAFAAAMAVNNETGVIMEWRAAAQMARSAGKPFFLRCGASGG
jgi:cysteine desulfurase